MAIESKAESRRESRSSEPPLPGNVLPFLEHQYASVRVLLQRSLTLQEATLANLGGQEQARREEFQELRRFHKSLEDFFDFDVEPVVPLAGFGGSFRSKANGHVSEGKRAPAQADSELEMPSGMFEDIQGIGSAHLQNVSERCGHDSDRRRRGSIGSEGKLRSSIALPDMNEGALDLRKKVGKHDVKYDMALEKFLEQHPIRGNIRRLVLKPAFDVFFAAVVLASVVLIGVEIECTAQHLDTGNFFVDAQIVCCGLFLLELFLRILAFGSRFLNSKDWKWNVFDTVCTVTMIFDIALEINLSQADDFELEGTMAGGAQNSRILRVLRLFRIIRALRIMRATRTSREFRKMSYALQYSAATLMWALVLLCFEMYFFATVFTQAATEHLALTELLGGGVTLSDDEITDLQKMYGSLGSSFYSLFQAISSGRDWWELVEPLDELHWTFRILFLMFVALTVFGVMNVVTSVFVESALQSVQHYKDLLIQESLKTKSMYMDHLLEVFQEIDADMSGSITLEEMEEFLLDPKLRMYLESMDIQPDDARTLFRLLDKGDSGCVSIDEFCEGCLRLKGEAKSFDIHCIIFENHRLAHKWQLFMNYLEKGFGPALTKAIEKAVDAKLGKQMERRRSVRRVTARLGSTEAMGDDHQEEATAFLAEPGQLFKAAIDDAPQIPYGTGSPMNVFDFTARTAPA